jgi:hypothetical protein
MTRRTVRLMRMTLKTDRDTATDPDYLGAFSDRFVIEDASEVVGVDWSVPGEVTITLLARG